MVEFEHVEHPSVAKLFSSEARPPALEHEHLEHLARSWAKYPSTQMRTFLRRLQRAGVLGPGDPVGDFFFVGRIAGADDSLALRGFGKRFGLREQFFSVGARHRFGVAVSAGNQNLGIVSADLRDAAHERRLILPVSEHVGGNVPHIQLLSGFLGIKLQQVIHRTHADLA